MELLSVGLHIIICCLNLLIFKKFMVTASDIDLYQVLVYHTSGAEVEVTHLRVAHLSVRKTYILSASLQMRNGIFCTEAVNKWSTLCIDCI